MTAEPPWLSVIMPTYNGEPYVAAALESVRAQRPADIEIVVVDDGSTDGTLATVRGFGGSLPLRVVEQRGVRNWVASTNAGLRAASGRYACFLHQDDLWLPGRYAAVRRVLEQHPQANLVLHPAMFVAANGARVGRWRCPFRRSGPIDDRALFDSLLVQNYIAIPAPVFERELVLGLGALDESLWYTADWDLWLRLARVARTWFIEEPLAAFRVHGASQTMAKGRTGADFRDQLETVLRRYVAGADGSIPRDVRRAAEFSVAVNVALAGAVRGERAPWLRLAHRFARLGPRGWRRYLRDSRVVERVGARLRVRLFRRRRPRRS